MEESRSYYEQRMAIIFSRSFEDFMKSVILLTLIFCCGAYGETCIGDEEARIKRSKSLLNDVEFSSEVSDSEIDAILNFPEQIGGSRIAKITLAKISQNTGKTEFIFPLEMKPSNRKVQAWYMLSESMAENNVVQAVYGSACGLLVQYQLDYKRAKLMPQ